MKKSAGVYGTGSGCSSCFSFSDAPRWVQLGTTIGAGRARFPRRKKTPRSAAVQSERAARPHDRAGGILSRSGRGRHDSRPVSSRPQRPPHPIPQRGRAIPRLGLRSTLHVRRISAFAVLDTEEVNALSCPGGHFHNRGYAAPGSKRGRTGGNPGS